MWEFVDSSPVMEIRVRNPLLGLAYPSTGGLVAVVDTGFSGFLLIPKRLFNQLGFGRLKTKKSKALSADGSEFELVGAFGSVEFPDVSVATDGLVETSLGASEVLIGMDGLRQLRLNLDCCARTLGAEACAAT